MSGHIKRQAMRFQSETIQRLARGMRNRRMNCVLNRLLH
jgi:hypothetical protein